MNSLRKQTDPSLISSLHAQHHSTSLSIRQCAKLASVARDTIYRRFAPLCPSCYTTYQRYLAYNRKTRRAAYQQEKAELARLHTRIRQLERQLSTLAIAHATAGPQSPNAGPFALSKPRRHTGPPHPTPAD